MLNIFTFNEKILYNKINKKQNILLFKTLNLRRKNTCQN